MSGKRRKKSLQQTIHKFFTEAKQTINSAQPIMKVENNIPSESQKISYLNGVEQKWKIILCDSKWKFITGIATNKNGSPACPRAHHLSNRNATTKIV